MILDSVYSTHMDMSSIVSIYMVYDKYVVYIDDSMKYSVIDVRDNSKIVDSVDMGRVRGTNDIRYVHGCDWYDISVDMCMMCMNMSDSSIVYYSMMDDTILHTYTCDRRIDNILNVQIYIRLYNRRAYIILYDSDRSSMQVYTIDDIHTSNICRYVYGDNIDTIHNIVYDNNILIVNSNVYGSRRRKILCIYEDNILYVLYDVDIHDIILYIDVWCHIEHYMMMMYNNSNKGSSGIYMSMIDMSDMKSDKSMNINKRMKNIVLFNDKTDIIQDYIYDRHASLLIVQGMNSTYVYHISYDNEDIHHTVINSIPYDYMNEINIYNKHSACMSMRHTADIHTLYIRYIFIVDVAILYIWIMTESHLLSNANIHTVYDVIRMII